MIPAKGEDHLPAAPPQRHPLDLGRMIRCATRKCRLGGDHLVGQQPHAALHLEGAKLCHLGLSHFVVPHTTRVPGPKYIGPGLKYIRHAVPVHHRRRPVRVPAAWSW